MRIRKRTEEKRKENKSTVVDSNVSERYHKSSTEGNSIVLSVKNALSKLCSHALHGGFKLGIEDLGR